MNEPEGSLLQALREEIAQFRLICNNVPVAIAYFERAGTVCRYANQAYAKMFGRTEADIIGLPLPQIIGDEAAAAIQPQVDLVIKDRHRARYERQLRDAQGRVRSIEVQLLPHLEGEHEAKGAFVLINDVTRHRATEAAVRESEERLSKFLHASAEGIVFHRGG